MTYYYIQVIDILADGTRTTEDLFKAFSAGVPMQIPTKAINSLVILGEILADNSEEEVVTQGIFTAKLTADKSLQIWMRKSMETVGGPKPPAPSNAPIAA